MYFIPLCQKISNSQEGVTIYTFHYKIQSHQFSVCQSHNVIGGFYFGGVAEPINIHIWCFLNLRSTVLIYQVTLSDGHHQERIKFLSILFDVLLASHIMLPLKIILEISYGMKITFTDVYI